MKTRSSSLWLSRKCGMADTGDTGTTSDASQIGTAVHAMIAQCLRNGKTNKQSALSSGLPEENYEDALNLFNYWCETFDQPIDGFQSAVKTGTGFVEKELSFTYKDWTNTGHCDYLIDNIVYDWKSGRVVKSAMDQMMSLAYSMDTENVYTRVWWVRMAFAIENAYTRQELEEWVEHAYTDLKNVQGKYVLGEHCRLCPNRLNCKAWRDNVKHHLDLVQQDNSELSLTEQTITWLDTIKRLIKVLKQSEKEITQYLKSELALNPTTIGDKTYYVGDKKSSKTIWNTPAAWNTVRKYLPVEELIENECIEFKKGNLVKAIRAHQKALNKGLTKENKIKLQDAENRLMSELADNGSMMSDTYPVIKTKGVD